MSLWDKDHPVWKCFQGLIALACLVVAVTHGVEGTHQPGVDGQDVAGVGGLALSAKLVWQFLKG